jgi:hypothetical protein
MQHQITKCASIAAKGLYRGGRGGARLGIYVRDLVPAPDLKLEWRPLGACGYPATTVKSRLGVAKGGSGDAE